MTSTVDGFGGVFFKWLCSHVHKKILQDTNFGLTIHVA